MAHPEKPDKASENTEFTSAHPKAGAFALGDQTKLNQSLRQISHDLNNYMTILLINIDQLREDLQETGDQALNETRQRQGERLKRLDLLSQTLRAASDVVHELTSPPEQAQVLEQFSYSALHHLLDSHLPVLQILAGEAISISLEPMPETMMAETMMAVPQASSAQQASAQVHLIPSFLKRCLIHMVRNSAEAIYACPFALAQTPEHHFTLKLSIQDTGFVLLVGDTGPGVPASLKPTLFEPGVSSEAPSLSSSFTDAARGYGMSAVAAMVQAWNGSVCLSEDCEEAEPALARSSPNGSLNNSCGIPKGAQFQITFPYAK
ncbi:MAG: sensor histidine kinase [Candidatus Puniceispirillaceae bacterium]